MSEIARDRNRYWLAAISVLFLPIEFAFTASVQDANDRLVLVRVVDTDDRPVSDAEVLLIYRHGFTVVEKPFSTDVSGVAIVELPAEPQRVTINILKSGYVPIANRWRIPGHEVPDTLDIRLQKGTTIGGVVRNTRGEPVAGAKVAIKLNSQLTSFYDDSSSNGLFILDAQHAPETNDDGRWTYSGVPVDAQVRISVTHPDYSADENFSTDYQRASQADLRAESSLAILADGIRIHGQILSSDGQSIPSADVSMKRAPPDISPSVHAKCDANGKFEMPATSPGKYEIAVAAKDHAPELTTYDTDSQRLPLTIRLNQGRLVALKVVDADGRPVKSYVSLEKNSGKSGTLLYYPSLLVPAETDDQGRFEWAAAPEGELVFSISATGFETAEATIPIQGAPPETIVRLQREPMLSGRVIDRKTKAPIDRFLVVPFVATQGIWRPAGTFGRNGSFQMPLSQLSNLGPEFHLMIEHAGHKTVLTDESFGRSSKRKELVIEMEAADPVSGVIVDDQGKPVANAQVSFGESASSWLPSHPMEFGTAKTDKSGAFQFPAPPDNFSVAAVGGPGYLQNSFRSDRSQLGELRLQPWSTVEGTVVDRNGIACADCIVIVTAKKGGHMTPARQTKTDRHGRFKLEHVAPVASQIWAYEQLKQGISTSGVQKKISISPGETTEVHIEVD
jgi:uncharacterized GH25 family protein